MIQEYYENGSASGVHLQCDKICQILSGKNWAINLNNMKDSIIFIDEGNDFIFSDDFASAIQNTDNYYIIVTREGIPSLPYSVEEIYGIRDSGKYGTLKQTYNEFYHLYQLTDFTKPINPEIIITEDSNAGFQFFYTVSNRTGIPCSSAGGKSNIFSEVVKAVSVNGNPNILVIADGAAFG